MRKQPKDAVRKMLVAKYKALIFVAVEASGLSPMLDYREARAWWGPVHREAFKQVLADLIRRYK